MNRFPNDADIGELFITYFHDLTKGYNLDAWFTNTPLFTLFIDPISAAIVRFRDHPSIVKIRSLHKDGEIFTFSNTNLQNTVAHNCHHNCHGKLKFSRQNKKNPRENKNLAANKKILRQNKNLAAK